MTRAVRYLSTAPAIALCATLMLGACGGEGTENQTGVTALNLETGNQKEFANEDEVPVGWAICPERRCVIPPEFPCERLGPGACLLSDQCRLKLRCEFDLFGYGLRNLPEDNNNSDGAEPHSDGAPAGVTNAAPSGCEFLCVPDKAQPGCDEIRDARVCEARDDCQWHWIAFERGEAGQDDNEAGAFCPPEICGQPYPSGFCSPARPQACEKLDIRTCKVREDCVWDPGYCDLMCFDPSLDAEGPCGNLCQPSCKPRPVPPVCPTIHVERPECEDGSRPVPQYDDQGCLVGYTCQPVCLDRPIYRPTCPNGEIEPIYDDAGCLIGYKCARECPAIELAKPNCTDDRIEPIYDEAGCLVGYRCVALKPCDALQAKYREALAEAKQCNPLWNIVDCADMVDCRVPRPCTLTMPNALGCSGCPTYVNTTNGLAIETLKRVQLEWSRAGCDINLDCMRMFCPVPQGAGCKADRTAGSSAGTCVDYGAD